MLKVGIVGAGRIGNIRSEVIRRSHGSSLFAVVDTDRAKAEKLAEGTHSIVSDDWSSICAHPDMDVVVVCTPTKFHPDVVIACLEAGKHVLCEKPLGCSSTEARRMYESSVRSRRLLKTGFNYRHMAHVQKAWELLRNNELGALYFLRCRYGHGGRPGYETEWCTDAQLSGGGALLEQGIHIFDLIRYLLGEPSRIVAKVERYFWNFASAEDNGFCLMETDQGQSAQIHISWTQWVNVFEMEIFGKEGYLRLEGRDGHYGRQRLIWGKRRQDHGRPEEVSFDFPAQDQSWDLEWLEFCSAIEQHREPSGSAADGLRAQQLVEAAYKSASTHSWIDARTVDSARREASQ